MDDSILIGIGIFVIVWWILEIIGSMIHHFHMVK